MAHLVNTLYVGNHPVFIFQTQDEVADRIKDKIVETCTWNKLGSDFSYYTGYVKKDDGKLYSFHDQQLYDWFDECLTEVYDYYFFPGGKVKINDCWGVKLQMSPGGAIHFHPFSMFTGLFYVGDYEAATTFYCNNAFNERWEFFLKHYLKNNNNIQLSYKPTKGQLLIWGSDLRHSVGTHRKKDPRYTLAFNATLSGSFGRRTARLTMNVGDGYTENGCDWDYHPNPSLSEREKFNP